MICLEATLKCNKDQQMITLYPASDTTVMSLYGQDKTRLERASGGPIFLDYLEVATTAIVPCRFGRTFLRTSV